ncbi:Cytoplasmic tRNA 2-thiolation protein 2 [Fasciolopsis buskii]|uniref:Cytoplasmic tRNA 2-thiolation protein 2 n=1 Tax=Fasciolopsis buskii TaxID=27845 RepID=A0A8E0RVP3_9TREM|nr:Cytoplasmic tRNA 2-thiolation protein 2 [Fasciolopsis buski]
MCSPEKICDLQLNLLPDRIKSDRRLKCVRCDGIRGKPALVIRTDDPAMCRFCFVDGCVHKFKSAFGKSQLVPNGSRVAVAFSGGLCSTVMLDLIQRSKVRFNPVVFHLVGTKERELRNSEPIRSTLKDSGLEFHILDSPQNQLLIEFRKQLRFIWAQSKFCMLTEVETLLVRLLLVHCARELGCEFVLFGTCGSYQAVNFLNGLVDGRGSMAASDTMFVDLRSTHPVILRPLFEFMSKELVFYARFQHLNWVTPENPITEAVLRRPGLTTVTRLCQDFLIGLQFNGFPSTTQTILSTASKLAATSVSSSSGTHAQRCHLCLAPIPSPPDVSNPHKLALASLVHSLSLSHESPVDSSINKVLEKEPKQEKAPQFCNACFLLYTDMTAELKPAFRNVVHQLHELRTGQSVE